jgi:hypothetical protein
MTTMLTLAQVKMLLKRRDILIHILRIELYTTGYCNDKTSSIFPVKKKKKESIKSAMDKTISSVFHLGLFCLISIHSSRYKYKKDDASLKERQIKRETNHTCYKRKFPFVLSNAESSFCNYDIIITSSMEQKLGVELYFHQFKIIDFELIDSQLVTTFSNKMVSIGQI